MLISVLGANAQFFPGPSTGPALVYSTPIAIVGESTSNLVSSLQHNIPVGVDGVGLSIVLYATNSVSTTNATFRLQGSVDGNNWINTPASASTIAVVAPQSGTTIYTSYTNIMPNTAAAQNIGNLRWLRVSSIQNTNLGTIWVSNMTWSIRR